MSWLFDTARVGSRAGGEAGFRNLDFRVGGTGLASLWPSTPSLGVRVVPGRALWTFESRWGALVGSWGRDTLRLAAEGRRRPRPYPNLPVSFAPLFGREGCWDRRKGVDSARPSFAFYFLGDGWPSRSRAVDAPALQDEPAWEGVSRPGCLRARLALA